MFIPQDGITEIVAHFIGYFHVHAEDMRYRQDYTPFIEDRTHTSAEPVLQPRPVTFHETLHVSAYIPSVAYTPPIQIVEAIPLVHSVSFQSVAVHIPAAVIATSRLDIHAYPASSHAAGPGVGEEPGSTVLIASQVKYLMDDDVVVVGDYAFEGVSRAAAHAELADMTDTALAPSSDLAALANLRSVPDILTLMDGMTAEISALSTRDFSAFDNVHVETADRLDGFYSNGASVDAQVRLKDAFPAGEPEAQPASNATTSSVSIDASQTPTTMHISSGANVSWNEALIVSAGASPAILAIRGDYHRIDAIYQTNVVHDMDSVDGNWPAQNLVSGGNVLQNSAGFKNTEYAADTSSAAAPKTGNFPQNWNVTTVSGDMIFMDWVQQYNFTSDNDTQILTTTGTNTYISSGLNLGLNSFSFADLGKYYDVIIVGGSVYDGNFISQTNVLLDSDNLNVLGESSAVKGNAATGDNVVWNEALIENVGATNWTQGLPSHYRDAADNLADGNKAMPSGFSSDSALEGFGNLKVLYVAGDIYDVHYINQVNVVGDADDLAIYESSLLKAQDSVWQVSTGQNTLVNKATILDYDSVGDTAYVGGQIYSEAVLVQADFLEGSADRVTVRGDALANEVLAFLHDQTDLSDRLDHHPAVAAMSDSGASFDVTQSMFA